ncbi:MAG: MOSC domain-containing protein [Bacteroidetes bacterium]|nr:MOSC domain-containing protein [Bacteroidota bacterium]MBS1569669.1 MOSC domain-containing protein [Bacteroidota bacterium]MBS1940099.1 MOSC domain-containing protein [Bacteroidota bacterium]
MMELQVASIHIYPVKSLGGFGVPQVRLTDRGLEHDRRWMLIDAEGQFQTQRTLPEMACLHTASNASGFTVTDVRNGTTLDMPWALVEGELVHARVWDDAVDLLLGQRTMHQWFSGALGRNVRIGYMPESTVRNTDPAYARSRLALNDAFPALVISQASLDDLNARLDVSVPMERFRPNVVLAGGEAYQEDKWTDFLIGDARFRNVKPCARCVIPNTDQQTAVRTMEPLRTLASYRSVGNKVMFGINAIFEGPGTLHAGDLVRTA